MPDVGIAPTPAATASPAPAAPSAVATPAATPVVPANAAVVAAPAAAVEPTPAAAGPSAAQPATAPVVVESLIGGPDKPVEPAPAADPAKPAEPGTVVYDLKLPDGVEVDAPQMDAAKAIFTEAKVPPEVAQKLTTFHATQMQALGQALVAKQTEAWNTTIRGWQTEITADKDLGGAKWTATKAAIEGGLKTVFGITQTTPANAPERAAHQAFVDALAITGGGSNPAIIRGLHRMVASRSEGRPAPVGGPSAPKKSPAETMYGNKAAAE